MLSDKKAIVTGASKGIGLEVSKLLTKHGVYVAGWSRSSPHFKDENFHAVPVDISDPYMVDHAYKETVDKIGEVDILINNAGYGIFGALEEMDTNVWEQMFATNVHGVFYVTKKVIPGMKSKEAGHIINVGSIAGKNPIKNGACYSATKHALTGLSHSLFMELRYFGIKVSCIYPGSVQTNFFDNIDEIKANESMMSPSAVAKSILDLLQTAPDYLPVDLEVRPLKPKVRT